MKRSMHLRTGLYVHLPLLVMAILVTACKNTHELMGRLQASPSAQAHWYPFAVIIMLLIFIALAHLLGLKISGWKKNKLKELIDQRSDQLYEANIILTDQREELLQKNEEITAQNDRLYQLSEEILLKNAELEDHHIHLEQLVAERTKELELAKMKAEESDNLKSAFLANMSHEIRTPMNAIVGFANLLKDTNYTIDEKQEFVDIITSNSEVLLILIQDILDLSLIEVNQLKIRKEIVDVNEVLENLHASISLINKKKGLFIKLNNELQHLHLKVKTDVVRLKQIITNLLNNAYKFTDSGVVELGLKKAGGDLIIQVKDTGIGISDEELPGIFDRFRKSETKKNVLYRGAGLGLAITKALSKLLDFGLKVESELGKGSVFTIVIPKALFVDQQTVTLPSPGKRSILDWEEKRILIVEDEKTNFIYLNRLLQKARVNVHWAQNGLEALQFIKSGLEFHLVLMDIKMPEMDGFEATKIIKSANPGQPVVALTAYARHEDRIRFSEAGFDDYLAKPVKPNDLLEVIQKYF
jgi:signal transduction histidine kinase/CheY-like chemotaxis protein